MNKQSAKEWLIKSWHNLSGAKILYSANHYTDVTAVEIHYSAEKSLKTFLAYQNKKISKTHDLIEIHELIKDKIIFKENELNILDIISEYHIEESYPAFDRLLPPKQEISEALDFTERLFKRVCIILEIDESEVKK